MDTFLSKEDTKVTKGIAIVMMLMSHLWGYPDRIAGSELSYLFNLFGRNSITSLGMFGRMCVSIFSFIGEYGLYISYNDREFNLSRRLKKLYFAY